MIYTVTTNPSIDYYMYSKEALQEGIHRIDQYEFVVAGKGVNVSHMLALLSMPSTCVVVCGGFTGDHIAKQLQKESLLQPIIIETSQESRINVKTRFHQKEMDLNTTGPKIEENAKQALIQVFDQVTSEDVVCINGSLQADCKETILQIANIIHAKKAKLILDIPNLTMEDIIQCRPYLIKPNVEEIKKLLGLETELMVLIKEAKTMFAEKGIQVFLSLGEAGSCYIAKDTILRVSSAKVSHVVNTVAAGDSLLAGFLYMQQLGASLEDTLKFASATGCASVQSTYLPTRDEILEAYQQVSVEHVAI